MTRKSARELAVRLVYSSSLTGDISEEAVDTFFEGEHYMSLQDEDTVFTQKPNDKQISYIKGIVFGVFENREAIDENISRFSKAWKLDRISKTALAVLRCAMYEMMFMDDIPDGVAINEAVEISKGYEEAETTAFINGVLGSYSRSREQ